MRRLLKAWWCRWTHQANWILEDTSAFYCPRCHAYWCGSLVRFVLPSAVEPSARGNAEGGVRPARGQTGADQPARVRADDQG